MKKYLLGLSIIFLFLVSVDASTGANNLKIKLEDVVIKSNSYVEYNGILEIKYEIKPSDADNKELIWSYSDNEKVEVIFINGNKTSKVSDTLKIDINNETEKTVKMNIIVKSGSFKKSIVIFAESKSATLERNEKVEIDKVESMIKKLPSEITEENEETTENNIESIKSIFSKNKELKSKINADLIDKYELAIDEYKNYREICEISGTIIIIVMLGITFIICSCIILKKEKK